MGTEDGRVWGKFETVSRWIPKGEFTLRARQRSLRGRPNDVRDVQILLQCLNARIESK